MKILILLFILTYSFANAQSPKDETQLLEIEKARSEAIASKNFAFLENLYAENFFGVTAMAFAVDKKSLMNIFSNFNSPNKVGPENLTVKLFDNSAIVSGRLVTRSPSGELINQSLFMHFYHKKDDKWVLIAGQGALIQEK